MNKPGRERRGPVERFAGNEHVFHLPTAAATLRDEEQVPRRGHRQVTLIHRDGISVVLFDFESGGQLSNHSADGLVIIHAIAGMLEVVTSTAAHTLPAGSLLMLSAGVVHDVNARHPSQMLLTIHLSTW